MTNDFHAFNDFLAYKIVEGGGAIASPPGPFPFVVPVTVTLTLSEQFTTIPKQNFAVNCFFFGS